jgi:choline dehydrogenase-like flavoprotein
MQQQPLDVLIVGSGPGGGIVSYVLATAGFKVGLVERGPRLRAGIDYNAHGSPYDLLDKRLSAGKPGAFSSVWADYAAKDHFTAVGDNPRHGFLPAVGGRSLCWAGHSLRFGPLDYRQWPISYDQVAPFYAKAERFMQVYGSKDGLWNLPDGVFEKNVPMRCPELALKRGVERLKSRGRRMEFVGQRKAIPTEQREGGRTVCHYCGHCMRGCDVDSKYTSANTPIPKALRTGNLTLTAGAMMTRILTTPDRSRVTGIEVQLESGERREIRCKVLVLACNSIETPRHLLINGLANSSGLVGRNLTSHFGLTVSGLFPELASRDVSNDDGTDYYHSLLTGMYWDKPSNKFEGTYQVQCGAGVHPSKLFIKDAPGWGSGFKQALKELNTIHASMNMQGTLLTSPKKFVDLDPEKKDQYGLPLPRVHLHYEDSDLAMARDVVDTCEEIILAAGGKVYSKPSSITAADLVIDSNHWVGSCRMGTNPKTSVVNTDHRSHDIPNLYVGDASVFAAYPEKNPTLTNITLNWRMAERLAARMKRGDI